MQALALTINEEIRSRVTYSVLLPRIGPEAIAQFILDQFDRAGLGHNTFSEHALALIVRSAEGILRRARNLCLSALIEAVRDRTKKIDLKQACPAIALATADQPRAHPAALEERL